MRSRTHKFYSFAIILITALLSTTAISPAAEAGNNNLISFAGGKKFSPPVQIERLKYSPSLAYIPTYTGSGSKNIEAVHYTGLPTGECYNLKCLTREDQATVLAWYQESLKQCGWKIDERTSSNCSITANRIGGLTCIVYTRTLEKSKFACELTLRLSIRQS